MAHRLSVAAIVALPASLLSWCGSPPASAATSVATAVIDFAYVGDHHVLVAKADDWRDPEPPTERARVGSPTDSAPPTPPSSLLHRRANAVGVASFTWDQPLRAHVRVRGLPARGDDAVPELLGESTEGWLAMRPVGPGRREDDGWIAFDMVGSHALPRMIAERAGEVRWVLGKAREGARGPAARPVELGRTRHQIFVLAGAPRRAASWPVTGAGMEPPSADHNAFTVFRVREAIRIARGVSSATVAAERAWRFAMHHYDLAADADLNPWALLQDGVHGQCMTTGAFIEAVFNVLGFENGRIAYVYPSLTRPSNPRVVAISHPLIPGAFTVEAAEYDVRGQFRTVAAAAGSRGHTTMQAALHRGKHGIERLKMRDWQGELHNYATAFIVEENGARAYFGGGYSAGPYPSADVFLAAACTAVVWAHEEDGAWETICDSADAGYWWNTGERFKP